MKNPFLFVFGMTNFYCLFHLYIAYSACSKLLEVEMFNDKLDAQVFSHGFAFSSQVVLIMFFLFVMANRELCLSHLMNKLL
jgi:hypothetical protein